MKLLTDNEADIVFKWLKASSIRMVDSFKWLTCSFSSYEITSTPVEKYQSRSRISRI